ncbi:MAG: glycosyltransferase, partial [Candidatus Korarchaeota archaeon]
VSFVGPILPDFPDESQEALKKKFGFDPEAPLIYIGISGPREERKKLTNILDKICEKIPKKYGVIYSRGEPSSIPPERKDNVLVYNWLEQRTEALRACDIYIGRSGASSLFEALALGKKIITIPARNQIEQTGNASRIEDLGAGIMIREENLSEHTLLSAIEKLESMPVNTEIQRIIRKYDGKKKLANVILSLLFRIS